MTGEHLAVEQNRVVVIEESECFEFESLGAPCCVIVVFNCLVGRAPVN